MNTKYYLIRRYDGCTTSNTAGVVGITTDLNYAKSLQSVFCGYEEVKKLTPSKNG